MQNDQLSNEMWMAAGGAMLVLLRSIVDGTRRSWYALLAGCAFGAAGAALAGSIFADSHYVYAICGVAAVMAENIVLGLAKASSEFKEAPLATFSSLWQVFVPFMGRTAGKEITDIKV